MTKYIDLVDRMNGVLGRSMLVVGKFFSENGKELLNYKDKDDIKPEASGNKSDIVIKCLKRQPNQEMIIHY